MTPRIEGTAGHDRQVVAGGQDVADVEAARLDGKLAVREPADLTVGAVHAEPGVDVAKLLDDLVEDDRLDQRRADIDADRRPHDGFDPAHRARPGGDHPRPAWSSAAWSDCA